MGAHHDHSHHHLNSSSRNILFALVLNASFAIIELIGGYLTGSVAILADALHDFGDSLSLGLAYALERLSTRETDTRFSYGYKRLSLLSALITSLILISGSVFILTHALPRLFNPVQPEAGGMVVLALLGVAVNGLAAWKVMQGNSLNEQTISWHMIEDVLGWVAVLIGSIMMLIWDVPIIDPLLSVIFTLVILFGVSKTFLATIRLFLQGVPRNLNLDDLKSKILEIEEVVGIHDVHVWSLDGASHVMTMHAEVDDALSLPAVAIIKDRIRKLVHAHGAFHLTLEIEMASETCPDEHCV